MAKTIRNPLHRSIFPLPRSQWLPGQNQSQCMSCYNEFSRTIFTTGQHHCRKCGNVICGKKCSKMRIRKHMVCLECYEKYKQYENVLTSIITISCSQSDSYQSDDSFSDNCDSSDDSDSDSNSESNSLLMYNESPRICKLTKFSISTIHEESINSLDSFDTTDHHDEENAYSACHNYNQNTIELIECAPYNENQIVLELVIPHKSNSKTLEEQISKLNIEIQEKDKKISAIQLQSEQKISKLRIMTEKCLKLNDETNISNCGDEYKDVRNWVNKLGLKPKDITDYFDKFIENGYDTIEFISLIDSKQELKDIGIVKPGHIKKIMFEITSLKQKVTVDEFDEKQSINSVISDIKNNDQYADINDIATSRRNVCDDTEMDEFSKADSEHLHYLRFVSRKEGVKL